MKKSIKKKLLAVAALAMSATMAMGAFVACGEETPPTTDGPGNTPPTPTHHARVEANCDRAGNIEYWEVDGKYYSDEGCTTEITQEQTVLQQRAHDFTNSTTYGKDTEGHHWKICAYSDCNGTGTPEAHDYTTGTDEHTCVCGDVEVVQTPFADRFTLWQWTENEANLGATTEALEDAIKVTATNPDGEAWHIKLTTELDNLVLGRVYEVTYTVSSNTAGLMKFEMPEGGIINDAYTLQEGENTVTYTYAVGKLTEGKAEAVLQLGALPANFEVTISNVAVQQVTGNNMEGWWLDNGGSASASKVDNVDGTITITATGDGAGYTLKLAKDVVLEEGHVYELTMVAYVVDRKNGNAKYVVYDGKASVDNDGLWWMDHDGVFARKFTITANDTCSIGACLEYGEIAVTEGSTTITVTYINLVDVTPAA